MAEDFLPEGFELAQEDKQKEIIPGFEVVEKTEVVATGAAPAAAGNQAARNTDSKSEDILSAYSVENLTTETEPEKTKEDKKKPKNQYRVVNIDGELKIFNKGGKNDLVSIEDDTEVGKKGKAKVVESIQVDEYLRNLNINFGDDDEGIVRYEKIELPNKGFNDIKDKAYDTEEKVTINIPGEDPLSKVVTENRDWYIPISIDPNTGEEIAGEPVMVNKNKKDVMLLKLIEAHNKSKLSSERKKIEEKIREIKPDIKSEDGTTSVSSYQFNELDGDDSMLEINIPGVEIVADPIIQADVNLYTDRITAAQALVKEKNRLLTNPDLLPEEKKKIQDELKDANSDLIHQYELQQKAARNYQIYQDNNPNIAFNEEDKRGPDANKVISNVNISYKLDENGEQIPILDSNGEPTGEFEIEKFKVANLDEAKQISQQEARTVTERINNNFLNYNIGADKDGDIVTVYKAPVMNDKGSIDIIATAKANGMPDSVIDQARKNYKTRNIFFNVQEEAAEKWMKENGFSKSAEFGYNKTLNLDANEEQLQSLEGFINFVQNEKGEYAVNENVSEFQTNHVDEVLVKRQQQNIKKQQKLANKI